MITGISATVSPVIDLPDPAARFSPTSESTYNLTVNMVNLTQKKNSQITTMRDINVSRWWPVVLAVGSLAVVPAALAQTVVISPQTQNYWAGVNTSTSLGVGSNQVTVASANGSTINFAVTGQPTGLTTLLSTNSCTNSTLLGLFLNVTNVAANAYPLTIAASGAASYATNAELFVVPQWVVTNNTANWSSGSSWSGGYVPGANDSVYIENQTGGFTNVVNSSMAIKDLVILGDRDANLVAGSVCALQISAGQTLSVLGTNGFAIGNKTSNAVRPWYDFSGAGTLLVSNPAANFVVDNAASSTRFDTVRMTNLNNLAVTVNRFGVGDATLAIQGLTGANLMSMSLAKTNVITALFADNYTNLSFNNSITYMGENDTYAGASQSVFFDLGVSNLFKADSLGVGRNKTTASGTTAFSAFGPALRFLPALSNSVTPTASVFLRNTNGGRMSLLAVGVDAGLAGSAGSSTKGVVDLRGGTVNALIDQIWLGRNRSNTASAYDLGGLYFDWGTINANSMVVGDMVYTNGETVQGYLLVGTNGTLYVNNSLELGHTPADNSAFPASISYCSGQIQINNGGTIAANQINVGQYSATNIITVNTGGNLIVTNGIASPTGGLTTLNVAGGQLTFFVQAGQANAYVTNLITSGSAVINIASLSGFASYPATNVLISYQVAGTHNIGIGALPPGFNNLQIVDNTSAQTISLIINTNAPKALVWHGGQNAIWDHASLNWATTNGTIVHFTDGDSVTFNDTAGVPTNIVVAETVNPGQTGTGITVSNTLNQFVFNNNGGGSIGSTTLVKTGTNSLEIDCPTTVTAQLNAGSIVGSGSVNNLAMAAGTVLDLAGAVNNTLTTAGAVTVEAAGVVGGAVTLQAGAAVTNSGAIGGALVLQTNTFLYNGGLLSAVGAATVATNATLINNGTIFGASLTVNGTLIDTVANSSGVSAGSINVGTLTINGKFFPGGNSIATTKVTDYLYNNSQAGNPSGRVQLNAGSTTTFIVNSTNPQPCTVLLSQNQGYGPSQSSKAINGCTLVITNEGSTAFAAGQSFQLFGNYYDGTTTLSAGANTTNSYPIIQPAVPGAGLAWDLSQLIPNGIISVVSASSVQVTVTQNTTQVSGTNLVTELTWPSTYLGVGWLQQQVTTTTTGIGANWVTVPSSLTNNDLFITNSIGTNAAVFYRFVYP